MKYPLTVTLLANGLPSGPTRMDVAAGTTMNRIDPSANWPFQSSASLFGVWFDNVSVLNDFLIGSLSVVTPYNSYVLNHVPFCVYVGDTWPQAPVGLVHGVAPYQVDDHSWVLFSVLFERPVISK